MKIKEIDNLSISAIRSCVIDTINNANSGHPGMSIGSAPILYTLYKYHLVANPKQPNWINRDRFVLSSGHASSLLYTMLHVCGYKVSIDDLKQFRQLNSNTPGHPEVGITDGVDASSGPLGQGIPTAVGFAVAEESIRNSYADGEKIMNHYTYCLCGDGCLQEGISQEAVSFAGHQKLNKLILFYDANDITLDGSISLSFSEDVKMRFKSSNWDVIDVKDGNDISAINKAIVKAKKSKDKPTLIIVHTIIGYGSAKQGTNKVHGSPLGVEDGKNAKVNVYNFDHEDFYIPQEVYDNFKKSFIKRGKKAYRNWKNETVAYKENNANDYKTFCDAFERKYDETYLPTFDNIEEINEASRNTSGKILNILHNKIPYIMGGSADVAGSVMTKITDGTIFSSENRKGRTINFGIREFAMASIQNGILLHGGLITYVGSFFVFSDYMKNAIRMAALSHIPAIYLFSHDSIAVGEDGPTHEPIEQLAMLRSIPNLNVIRACDANEVLGAYDVALKSKTTPTAIILSRQNLQCSSLTNRDLTKNGAYVVGYESKKRPSYVIIATGSEVGLAMAAKEELKEYDIRVVSMPSMELFEAQKNVYKRKVLPLDKSKTISVEMLSTFGWGKYANHNYGIDTFGLSAPNKKVMDYFGFTKEKFINYVKNIIENKE